MSHSNRDYQWSAKIASLIVCRTTDAKRGSYLQRQMSSNNYETKTLHVFALSCFTLEWAGMRNEFGRPICSVLHKLYLELCMHPNFDSVPSPFWQNHLQIGKYLWELVIGASVQPIMRH
jgi:hypothetical protein